MSNRSAKLLLEVAQTLELYAVRGHPSKLAGDCRVSMHPGLIDEVRAWGKGYKNFLTQRQKQSRIPE